MVILYSWLLFGCCAVIFTFLQNYIFLWVEVGTISYFMLKRGNADFQSVWITTSGPTAGRNPPLTSGGLQIRHSMSEKWGFFRLARALTPKIIHRIIFGALKPLHEKCSQDIFRCAAYASSRNKTSIWAENGGNAGKIVKRCLNNLKPILNNLKIGKITFLHFYIKKRVEYREKAVFS